MTFHGDWEPNQPTGTGCVYHSTMDQSWSVDNCVTHVAVVCYTVDQNGEL